MMWWLYIIECKDGSLYTGITTDVNRRMKQHNTGKGAKYTQRRYPVKLLVTFEFDSRSSASKEEYRIKQLSRKEKFKLIYEANL